MADARPANCRFRLQEEGKAYPRSSCKACGRSILTGLGNSCGAVGDVSPLVVSRIAELEADLADTLRAVLHHFGPDGARKVTTTTLDLKSKRSS